MLDNDRATGAGLEVHEGPVAQILASLNTPAKVGLPAQLQPQSTVRAKHRIQEAGQPEVAGDRCEGKVGGGKGSSRHIYNARRDALMAESVEEVIIKPDRPLAGKNREGECSGMVRTGRTEIVGAVEVDGRVQRTGAMS